MTINENDIYKFATDDSTGTTITYTSANKAALTYPFWSHNAPTAIKLGRQRYVLSNGVTLVDSMVPQVGLAQLEPVVTPSLIWLDLSLGEYKEYDLDRGLTLWMCKEKYNPLTTYPWHFYFGDPFALRMHISGAPTVSKVKEYAQGYASYYGVPVFGGCFDYYVWWYGTAGQCYCLPFSVVDTEYSGKADTTRATAIPVYIGQYTNFGQTINYSTIRPSKSLRLRCAVPLSDDDYQTAATIAASPYYYYADSALRSDMKRCYMEEFSTAWETGNGDKTIEITIKLYE